MSTRKSVALYRKNLHLSAGNSKDQEHWLYSQSEFDKNGNLTEQTVYSQSGSMMERTVNEYNEKGFLIREKYFVDEGSASEEKSYERNENGLIVKEFMHYADGSFDTTVYNYDSQSRITTMITTNDEGEIEKVVIHEYRDDFLVSIRVLDGEETLLKLDEYKYDEKGNSVEHKRVDSENNEESFTVTIYNNHGRKQEETVFDEDGDILSQTFYEEDEKGRLNTIREEGVEKNLLITFSYDEHGNATRQEETDGEGKQLVLVQREFDEHNNMTRSEVYVDGQGLTLPQHYEILFEYSFYD